MLVVYRLRKKDEGSYALDEPIQRHPAESSMPRHTYLIWLVT